MINILQVNCYRPLPRFFVVDIADPVGCEVCVPILMAFDLVLVAIETNGILNEEQDFFW